MRVLSDTGGMFVCAWWIRLGFVVLFVQKLCALYNSIQSNYEDSKKGCAQELSVEHVKWEGYKHKVFDPHYNSLVGIWEFFNQNRELVIISRSSGDGGSAEDIV